MDVKDGKAFITGGAQGIGRAVCEALLSRGCKVCCADINAEIGTQTVEELQKIYGETNCIFVKCDVSCSDNFEEAYLKAKQSLGNFNIFINNAGVCDDVRIIDINLKGTINGCNIAYKYMGKKSGGGGGVVVNVASEAGIEVYPYLPIYAASKSGVIALTRNFGHELHYEETGIKFNAICPSAVRTNMSFPTNFVHFPMRLMKMYAKCLIMEPSKVAEAIIQIIQDDKNGAVMLVVGGKENTYVTFSVENL